jgi:hypothetical protein
VSLGAQDKRLLTLIMQHEISIVNMARRFDPDLTAAHIARTMGPKQALVQRS